jgi:cell division protein FtsW
MQVDRGILLAVVFLLGLGLVQVYSSSFIFATETYGDGLFFFRKQLIFVLIAMGFLLTSWLTPWQRSSQLGITLWFFAVICVIGTFIPGVGLRIGGAHRWLNLPFGLRFEPGELLRVTYPFVLAPLLSDFAQEKITRDWWVKLIFTLSPLLLLAFQPDFGSFVIVLVLTLGLFIGFGLKWRYILGGLSVVIPTLAIMILATPYRRLRVEAFLNPWADPAEKGFQVIQSMLSFYSGGLTGVGIGQGQGKLFFLPEAHTDFTLAVLAEELGFIGFALLLLVFGFLVFRAFQVALDLKRRRERAIALSIALLLAISVFINVGVALGLLPTKGLTLPLISYGGSSLICTALMVGWLLNLERISKVNVSFRDREVD